MLDSFHALKSFQLPHEEALDEVENHRAKAEISVEEEIGDIKSGDEIEVGEHVLDPESCDGRKEDLEAMSLSEKVEEEAGAPETQVNGRGRLQSSQAVRPVGWAAISFSTPERERSEILPGFSRVLIARCVVLLVGEDERHDECVQGGELGHSVQMLGHVAWIVVVRVAFNATTAIFDVGAAGFLGCNSNRKQSCGTEGKLGHT